MKKTLRFLFCTFLTLILPLCLSGCSVFFQLIPLAPVLDHLGNLPEEMDVPYVAPAIPAEEDDTNYFFEVEDYEENPYRPYYNLGTNRALLGRPVVAIFFVDDDESSWDVDTIKEFTEESILPALDFLEEQAEWWDVPLEFTVWRYSTALSEGLTLRYEGSVIKDLDASPTGSTKDMMDQVAADMGYASAMALHAALTEQAGGREVIPLFFINKDGVSYARNRIAGTYVDYCEQSIIFRCYLNQDYYFAEKRAVTVAFHMLHMYGAQSLFTPKSRLAIAEEYYPHSIMLNDYSDLEDMRVDLPTAYSIGWTVTVPNAFKLDEWWG